MLNTHYIVSYASFFNFLLWKYKWKLVKWCNLIVWLSMDISNICANPFSVLCKELLNFLIDISCNYQCFCLTCGQRKYVIKHFRFFPQSGITDTNKHNVGYHKYHGWHQTQNLKNQSSGQPRWKKPEFVKCYLHVVIPIYQRGQACEPDLCRP